MRIETTFDARMGKNGRITIPYETRQKYKIEYEALVTLTIVKVQNMENKNKKT